MRRPGSGSSPGMLNTAFVTVLMVLFAGFALTSRQAGPPPIAEFAPQALKQIDEAPEESDLSRSGTGSGARGGDTGIVPTPSPAVDATVPEEQEQPESPGAQPVDPPRFSATCANGLQNRFDPQSPPCMPFTPPDLDNGGATAPGVTRDTIKVAFAVPGGSDGRQAERARAHTVLANFFATNFVHYGRRIELVDYSPQWKAAQEGGGDPAWRAIAADLAAQGVFAVVGRQESTEFEFALARKGIISVNADNKQLESTLQQYSPYLYGYAAGGDTQVDGLTTYACQKLAGRNAEFAGPKPGKETPRKFAIMVGEGVGTKVLGDIPGVIRDQMQRKCGVSIPPEHIVYIKDGDDATNFIVKTAEDGVTTLLFTGNFYTMAQWGSLYDNVQHFPEYVSTSYFGGHNNFLVSTFAKPTQRRQFINLNFGSQSLLPSRTPGLATIRYQDPQWRLDPSEGNATYDEVYKPMAILAAGIQLAGPNLTPTTFRDGLHRTRFPNPSDTRALGKVGFDTGDHTFVDDAQESFWAEGATGPDGQNAGAWCYPTQQRFGFQGRADWGSDTSRYFKQPCETGRGV